MLPSLTDQWPEYKVSCFCQPVSRWLAGSIYDKPDQCNQFPSQQRYRENSQHLSLLLFIWLFICSSFNDAVSNSDHAGLNDWMKVNNGIESTWGKKSGRCLLWGTIPALLWKDQAKPRKDAVGIVDSTNFESGSPSLPNAICQCVCASAPKVNKIQQKLTKMTAKAPYYNYFYGTVLLAKSMFTQLFKKFLVFYGTRTFITVSTTDRPWSLSPHSWTQSKLYHLITFRSI
jgi:hypothetical protein